MTRRQASTVAWSPRSLAASSTSQAVSKDSGARWSEAGSRSCTEMPGDITFIADFRQPTSSRTPQCHLEGAAIEVRNWIAGILARLIEFQHAPGRLRVDPAVLGFRLLQFIRGDAVIFGAQEKQGHRRRP